MTTLVLTTRVPTLRRTWNAFTTGDSDANAWYGYDYAGQDPINGYDLTGTCKKHRGGWFHRALCASLDAAGNAAIDEATAAVENELLGPAAIPADLVSGGQVAHAVKKTMDFAAKHVEQLDYVGAAAFCAEGAGFAFEATGNPYAAGGACIVNGLTELIIVHQAAKKIKEAGS